MGDAPDLARLIERQGRMLETLVKLAERPALALTPQTMAAEIAEAGRTAGNADHELLEPAVSGPRAAPRRYTVIGHARPRQRQVNATTWAGLAGMPVTIMLFVAAAFLRERLSRDTCCSNLYCSPGRDAASVGGAAPS